MTAGEERTEPDAHPAWSGEWHPFAERFPMLDEAALRELAASIKEVGQLDACKMAPDGTGLDGRNRIAACKIAGVEPLWVVTEADPVDVIIGQNVRHRHMKPSAQAMAVAIGMEKKGLRANGRWKRGTVPAPPPGAINGSVNSGSWSQRLNECGVILDWRPDLADGVLRGDPLDAAYQQATAARDQEITAVDLEAEIKALPADLAALVESGHRTLPNAKAEAADRKTVADIDKTVAGDGQQPYAERVASGAMSWQEATRLATQWFDDRTRGMKRNRDRIKVFVSELPVAQSIMDQVIHDPNSLYIRDMLDGLAESDRIAFMDATERMGGSK